MSIYDIFSQLLTVTWTQHKLNWKSTMSQHVYRMTMMISAPPVPEEQETFKTLQTCSSFKPSTIWGESDFVAHLLRRLIPPVRVTGKLIQMKTLPALPWAGELYYYPAAVSATTQRRIAQGYVPTVRQWDSALSCQSSHKLPPAET